MVKPPVRLLTDATLARRLVVEAKPETNKLVVVALVVVELRLVKFWRVVEPETYKSPWTSSSAPVVVVAEAPITRANAVF